MNQSTAVPDGLWQRQFATDNDFPQTEIIKKIVLCTTPRCGSHFLGHQMHRVGCFGYPLEYLNPGNWTVWSGRARDAGATDTLDYIKSVRTGPNGVFAVKLHHEHLKAFLAHDPDPLSYSYVHLQRRDLIKQAVSFARAQQTGAWISDMPATVEASYDRPLISEKVTTIARGNADWQAYLSSLGIAPLNLFYEDVLPDMDQTLGRIADHLGVTQTDSPEHTSAFTPQQQQKSAQEDWAARYKSETRKALLAGEDVPGAERPRLLERLDIHPIKAARRIVRKTLP